MTRKMESYDVILCVGPKDADILVDRIANFRKTLIGLNSIFVISAKVPDVSGITFIHEDTFPFSISEIDKCMGNTGRGGWYLQQLLKLYAAREIPGLLENFLIVDADVYFHRPVRWFEGGRVQFNCGWHKHTPYFEHMAIFTPFLKKQRRESGICHLMPMKKGIVLEFIRRCEDLHAKPFWISFLESVKYYHSGASEYELLFEFGLTIYPEICCIRPLKWTNSPAITAGFDGDYEACHHYMRR